MRIVAWSLICVAFVVPAWAKSPGQDALDRGVEYFRGGKFENAVLLFKQATELDPALLKAWENLGLAYRKLRRDDDALAVWKTLQKVEPGNTRVLNDVAALYVDRGDNKLALTHYEKSLHLAPNQPQILLRAGDLYLALGYSEAAMERYLQLARYGGYEEIAYLRIVAQYEAAGTSDRAIEFLERIAGETNMSSALRQQLARLYGGRGDQQYKSQMYSAAEEDYRRAQQWSDDGIYAVNLGWALRKQGDAHGAIAAWTGMTRNHSEYPELYRTIADAYRDLGDNDAAKFWYEKAYQEGDDPHVAAFRLVDAALRQADRDTAARWSDTLLDARSVDAAWPRKIAGLYVDSGHADWGLAYFEVRSTRTVAPSLGDALSYIHNAIAGNELRAANLEPALDHYRQALRFNPSNTAALRDLGWTYWRMERWDDCSAAWTTYVETYPESVEPYNLLLQLHLYRKDYKAAIVDAQRSLTISPGQIEIQLKQAKALYLDNQFALAKLLVEKLAAANPNNLRAQTFLAEFFTRQQDFTRAAVQWEGVLKIDPQSPRARFQWLRARYEAGELDAAIRELQAFINQYGPSEAALRLLADDALARADRNDAARWMEKLVEFAPERPEFWLGLLRLYADDQKFTLSRDASERARAYHPGRVELMLADADLDLAEGANKSAYEKYLVIVKQHPNYQPAQVGVVHALIADKNYRQAIQFIDGRTRDFWKDYEADLLRANVLLDAGEDRDASEFFDRFMSSTRLAVSVPILLYHGVSNNPRSVSTFAGRLDDQMKALSAAGYTPITVREFAAMLDGKLDFPGKPILITFDDARRDSFEFGDAILKKYGFKATMFVPTARVVEGHPFYADWNTIEGFHANGRWDLQSHGHHAHDPIDLDEVGNAGSFLVNRQWLTEMQRLERSDEYVQRLESDYVESKQLLATHFPDLNVVSYAFPFSEAGQQRVGNEADSFEQNRALLRRHYRFGLIQDTSGYNLIQTGEPPSLYLRRFAVPRDMDGAQLIRHLNERNPEHLARLADAQAKYWQGQYASARERFVALDAQDAAPRNKTQYFLASIALRQQRNRDAQDHISNVLALTPEVPPAVLQLRTDIAWKNRPWLNVEGGVFQDANNRTNHWFNSRYQYAFDAPVELWVGAETIAFAESDYTELQAHQATVGAAWHTPYNMSISAQAGTRSIQGHGSTNSGALSVAQVSDGARIKITGAREDVDTLRAQMTALQSDVVNANIDVYVSRRWSGLLVIARRRYDDGNDRRDARAGVYYTFYQFPGWRLGIEGARADTRFAADAYYTPRDLRTSELVARYRLRDESDWTVEAKASTGVSSDALHEQRWVFNADAEVAKNWSALPLKTSLNAAYQDASSYHSWVLSAGAMYRF